MGSQQDALGKLAKGDPILAEWLNKLASLATSGNVPAGGIQDVTGSYPPGTVLGPYWRLAITAANPNEGPYPKPEDKPNTYWFNFLRVDLSTTPLHDGDQSPSFVATSEPMGLCHWLGNRYLPEGTMIRVWKVAPGRSPEVADSRSDMWVAYDQQQVAGYVTFTLKDALAKNQETVTAIFDEDGYWDGQQPWDEDDNPEREFNLVNTGLMFPWETGVTSYPVGTKGSACLDPESTKADALSYRIIFMAYPADESIGGPPTTIDVVICSPANVCGNYLRFYQKRLHLPPGTTITDLPSSLVPIYVCESSNEPPPSQGDPPEDSQGSASSGQGGTGWTDDDIVFPALVVSGTLDPAGATGEYSRGFGYYNGRPFWFMFGGAGTYMIWWHNSGKWIISKLGDPTYWYKKAEPNTPVGDYTRSPSGDGIATVTEAGLP